MYASFQSLFCTLLTSSLFKLFWNILLICIGRHPLQNPHFINPEIGKLSKNIVEKIPLVLYIPPPPDSGPKLDAETSPSTDPEKADEGQQPEETVMVNGILVVPEEFAASNPPPPSPLSLQTPVLQMPKEKTLEENDGHTYPPPSSPSTPSTKKTGRFSFLRTRSSRLISGAPSASSTTDNQSGSEGTWEDNWERGPQNLPLVRLAGNRAVCAVCLMDLEAPKRRASRNIIRGWSRNSLGSLLKGGFDSTGEKGKGGKVGDREEGKHNEEHVDERRDENLIQEVPAATPQSGSHMASEVLRLEDAGEGAQPLRLLPCGHVFHVSYTF